VLLLAAGVALVLGAVWLAALPRSIEAHERRAIGFLDADDPRSALESLDLALDRAERDGADGKTRYELLTRRGRLNLDALHRPTAALEDFIAAQGLEPGEPRAWDHVGEAYLKLKQYDEAARHFEQATTVFPDRERWFRYTSAAARWRASRVKEEQGEELIEPLALPGLERTLDRALERFASSGVQPLDAAAIEATLLKQPHGTAEVKHGFELLLAARADFKRADEQMADYETSPELSPRFGRVRLEMHRQTGRYYELDRTAEVLLRAPRDRADKSEFESIQFLRANALHDQGLPDLAAEAFVALRDELARRKDPAVGEAMTRAEFLAIDERLAARQYAEAGRLFDWFSKDLDAPTWFPFNLYGGLVRQARGDATGAVPLLDNAAHLLLDTSDHVAWAFRDEAERRRQVTWLAEALLRAGRTERALDVATFLLADAPDLEEARTIRAAALRATHGREWDTCVEDLVLLRAGRDGGRRFAQWEADWIRMRGGPARIARDVADQGARVLRVFSNDLSVDQALTHLVKGALASRGAGKGSAANDLSFQTAGSALLHEVEGDPGMALQVYRWLLVHGHRDEAFLLCNGLVEAEPQVADFRLLLARQDLADGRLRDTLAVLEGMLERRPDDVEVATLASDVARRTFDFETARRIEDRALGVAPAGAKLLLAARAALADGYPDLVLSMARTASAADADGRALLGLAARALVAAGDLDAADALARPVLAQDPAQRDALAAFLAVRGAHVREDGTSECDAWLAEHPTVLAGLDVDAVVDLGRMLLSAGDAASAERVLRGALERDREHALARLTLADALLTLRKDDELEKLLDPAHLRNDDIEGIRRIAMLRLLRDGPIPAHTFLRDHIAAGASEDALARFTVLTGAAAGRIEASFGLAARRGLPLDRDEKRLLALAVLAWNAPARDAAALPEVAALTRLPADDAGRDRELERWLSLDLASPDHRFLGSLVALALLERAAELTALHESVRTQLFATVPSLGEIARREARRLDERGDRAGAAAVLWEQVVADPRDADALRALVLVADVLTGEQLDGLCDVLQGVKAPAGLAIAMNALRERMRGDPARARALLEEAAADPATRPVARLVQAQLAERHDVLTATLAIDLAPWCDVATRAHALSGDAAVDRLLGDALDAAPEDRLVLAALRHRLATAGERIEPPQRKRYVYALVKQPGPWFEAFESALATAAHAPPDAARANAFALALGAAIEDFAGPVLPTSALRALARLADLEIATGQLELAARTIARAEQACPLHHDLLAAKGRLALAGDDERTARRCFGRARAFGSRAPDVLHWLGRDALAFGQPRTAVDLEEQALAGAAASDPAQRAEMNEVLARARFMLGATAEARAAWTAAAHERGEDPERSIPIALETFAREGPEAAKARLETLAASPGPAQDLARALLGIAARVSTDEPLVPSKSDETER
jgi:hypothetical protein